MMRTHKSQSILEYVIILTAIVAGIVFAATNIMQPAVQDMFTSSADVMDARYGDFTSMAGGGVGE